MKVVFQESYDERWEIFGTNPDEWPEHAIEMTPEEHSDLERVNKEWRDWQVKIDERMRRLFSTQL